MNGPDPLDHFDRRQAAREWLLWVDECDRDEAIASACVRQIVDPDQSGLDPSSLFITLVDSHIAFDRLNAAMLGLRAMLRADDTPIPVDRWVVYLNDRGNPAYTAAIPSRREAAPCPSA